MHLWELLYIGLYGIFLLINQSLQGGEELKEPQGRTSFGKRSYGGPCPPGETHRYFFKLYALDTMLELEQGLPKSALEKAMTGHMIEKAELIGKYSRH